MKKTKSHLPQPPRVDNSIATAQIESTKSQRRDGELASAIPQASDDALVRSGSTPPIGELVKLNPSDVPRYAARPLARLWSLVMLSCGLRPTIENEELAYQRGGSPEYRSRLRMMRGRVLDRRFHPVDEPLPGYLLNFYLVDAAVAADDSVDDQFVRVSDFLAIAKHEGWNLDRRFFERPLNGLAAPPLLMEIEETPPGKVRGASLWNEAHHKILLGLLKLLSADDDRFRPFFDALVGGSNAAFEANVEAEVDKLLKSEIGKTVLEHWCVAMDEATEIDGAGPKTVKAHLHQLALFVHRERKKPQKKPQNKPK